MTATSMIITAKTKTITNMNSSSASKLCLSTQIYGLKNKTNVLVKGHMLSPSLSSLLPLSYGYAYAYARNLVSNTVSSHTDSRKTILSSTPVTTMTSQNHSSGGGMETRDRGRDRGSSSSHRRSGTVGPVIPTLSLSTPSLCLSYRRIYLKNAYVRAVQTRVKRRIKQALNSVVKARKHIANSHIRRAFDGGGWCAGVLGADRHRRDRQVSSDTGVWRKGNCPPLFQHRYRRVKTTPNYASIGWSFVRAYDMIMCAPSFSAHNNSVKGSREHTSRRIPDSYGTLFSRNIEVIK